MEFHSEIHAIGFKHRDEITKALEPTLQLLEIMRAGIFVINPEDIAIFFSTSPSTLYKLIEEGHGNYITSMLTKLSNEHEFYTCGTSDSDNLVNEQNIAKSIENNLENAGGFMMVRNLDGFKILYNFVTNQKSQIKKSNIINNLNHFLAVGDAAYNRLQPLVKIYNKRFVPPLINKFYPFVGGAPTKRFTMLQEPPILTK